MMFNRSFVYFNAESKCVSSNDDSIHPEVIITQKSPNQLSLNGSVSGNCLLLLTNILINFRRLSSR